MHVRLSVESPVASTPRVLQVRGLFDIPADSVSSVAWDAHLPLEERPWSIGLITGPSGCGKSTLARHLWPEEMARSAALEWPRDQALVDAFPRDLPVKDIAALLSAVGFSSPTAWL